MTALTVDIADGVLTVLNAASADDTLSQTFTATRVYYVHPELHELSTLTAYVVPGPWDVQPGDRAKRIVTRDVDVVFLQQVDPTDNDAVDPLVVLQEETIDLFWNTGITANSKQWKCLDARPVNPEAAAIEQELFKGGRVFAAVIRTTWIKLTQA